MIVKKELFVLEKEKIQLDKVDAMLTGFGVAGIIFFVKLLEQAILADHLVETLGYGFGAFLSFETASFAIPTEVYLLYMKKKDLLEEKKRRMENDLKL